MDPSSGSQYKQVVAGLRVVRGPDWKWGNQDASEGYVGTVVEWKKNKMFGRFAELFAFSKGLGVVSVIWDCGMKNDYRIGHEGAFDLRIIDNSATGVVHPYTGCSECCIDSNIIGIRWHCETCDESICSSCFFRQKHDQTHTKYKRYETPNTPPVDLLIDPTKTNERVELKGIFPGARVKRGHDWEKADEDTAGGTNGVGTLMVPKYLAPGMVEVKWQNGEAFHYRLGSDGKVDIQLVKVASGGFYHPDHLPVLKSAFMKSVTNSDGEIKFAVGDLVQIHVKNEEELKRLQDGHGGYVSEIKNFIGKTGKVRSLNEVGVIVVYEDGDFYNLNPETLVRMTPFSNDQPVRIKDDEPTILAMENFGLHMTRKQLAGETGRVVQSSFDNDFVEVILDSDKKNERRLLHRDWIEIVASGQKLTKGMAKLKSKMVSVFVKAAGFGQLNTVKELLSKFPINIDAKNDSGETALHSACRNGHLEVIKELYFRAKEKNLMILDQQDGKGKTAIHHAAEGCNWKVFSFLIKPENGPTTKGVDLNAKDKRSLTPLQVAVRAGCLQSVNLLIEHGSDINSQDSDGDTALHNAIIIETQYYRDPEIINALLKSHQINFKLQNKKGLNPLLISIIVKNRIAFDQMLKVGGEELAAEEGTEHNLTALHFICYQGELKFAKIFLKHAREKFLNGGKGLIDKPCERGFTPLTLAVLGGHYALVELLVEQGGANVKVTDDDGDTLVHLAAIKLESFKEEPSPQTSPQIFKIHAKLRENSTATLINYPGLSLICYLISKGCLWKKTYTRKAHNVITNELVREVLENFVRNNRQIPSEPEEEPMDDENDLLFSEDGCLFCPSTTTIVKEIKECGHTTNIACLECFQTRLYKCPTCRQLQKPSSKTSRDGSSTKQFEEDRSGTLLTPVTEYIKNFSNNGGSFPVSGRTGTTPVQQTSSQYSYYDPGPSTSNYQASSYQQQNNSQFITNQTYNNQTNCLVSHEPDNNMAYYSNPYQPTNNYPAYSNLSTNQQHQEPSFFQQNFNQSCASNNLYNSNIQQNMFNPQTTPMGAGRPSLGNWNPINQVPQNPLQLVVVPNQASSVVQSNVPNPTFNTSNQQQRMQTTVTVPPTAVDSTSWQNPSEANLPIQQNMQIQGNVSMPTYFSAEETFEPNNGTPTTSGNFGFHHDTQSTETVHQVHSANGASSDNSVSLNTAGNYINPNEIQRKENGNKEGTGPILIYKGDRYSRQRIGKRGTDTTTWQCTKNAKDKNKKCAATIVEENNFKYRIGVLEHDHRLSKHSSVTRNGNNKKNS